MTEQKSNTTQEVDLVQLFTNIGNWFNKKIKGLISIGIAISYFFIRNIIWFAISVAIALISTLFMKSSITQYYHCEFIGYSNTISSMEVVKYINNWNYSQSFSKHELEGIKEIRATYLLDLNNDKIWDKIENPSLTGGVPDTAIMNDRVQGFFAVIIDLRDSTLVSGMRDKVLNFLTSIKRVQTINEIRLKQMAQLIPIYEKEITELDSLKKFEYFRKTQAIQAKGESMLEPKETRLYHSDIISLNKQKLDIEKNLFLSREPFEIIYDLSVPKSIKSSFKEIILYRLKLALLICLVFVLIYDQRVFFITQYKKAKNAQNQ